MSNPNTFRTERTSSPRSKRRRATGVSRRQRRKQLGFETLEDRRVMSAQSPLASLQGAVSEDAAIEVQSYSSSTPEGALQIYLNELYWSSLAESANSGVTYASTSLPTDPLVNDQWHLINVEQSVGNPDFQAIFGKAGEDINIAPVYNNTTLTGAGVVVAVIDSALQFNHPDLAANVSDTLGLSTFSGNTGPTSAVVQGDHGTSVAGLIGAVANNGLGGSGVAPGVTLVPIEFLSTTNGPGNPNPNATVDAFRYETDQVDITNNSWGPVVDLDGDGVPDGRGITNLTEAEVLALRDSIIFGRDGKGVIHVFASGNSGANTPFNQGFNSSPDDILSTASYNGWVNSRYTIGVTGVDHDGFYNNVDGSVTGFAEAGTSVLVAAPTGSGGISIGEDSGIGSGIFTTDLTGEDGFNFSPDPISNQEFDRDFLADTDYTSRFGGTSAAAPLVTGVIALMLEANPELSYRDVQDILVRSARQNAEFEIPNAVFPLGAPTQNTWIQNQTPVFHDPDVYDPQVAPGVQTITPTLDPNLGFTPTGPNANLSGGLDNNHFQPTPRTLTNGAGYTVSQGRGVYGEEIGYAHGVVDAELAVQLAQQWTTKNQELPSELTFTSFVAPSGGFFIPLPAAEVGNQDSGFQYVPGGLGGGPGFISYWEEFFTDDPFDNFTFTGRRGGYVNLTVPDNNAMVIENVGVKITATGGEGDFLDHVRVLLVSPTGTHHDLNPYFVERFGDFSLQNLGPATFIDGGNIPGSVDADGNDTLIANFNSNRSWGERSDDALIFNPTTLEPYVGLPDQSWQLHFENYSNTNFQITGMEIDWHGSPIVEANTQRIQGLVGVDDGVNGIGARDDAFNFSRVALNNTDTDGILRLGEITNTIDTTHESMGANVTVTARRASDGVVVDQFVTGADGNYFFDLVPDDYIISVEDAAGRTAVDDTLSPAGFLKDFQSEWLITEDYFQVWDYDANLEVPMNAATNAPFAYLDPVSNAPTTYHVNHINFLLDPGAPSAPQVDFSGSIFADINGDGIFNSGDVAVPGVGVFGDVNRNGELDAGEILVTTDASGQYSLTVPIENTTVMDVGVRPPADWTASNPDSGTQSFFAELGKSFTGVDFHIQPPSVDNSGDGSPLSGIILGIVFNDKNNDMLQQADEFGVPNTTVFLDGNNSGTIDPGEPVTQTNSNGAYVFANVPNGSHHLRMVLDPESGITQTFPDFDLPQFASIVSGGTDMAVDFGVSSGIIGGGGIFDFGDLPDSYGTKLADDGARHPEGHVFLGSIIDSEPDGLPSSDALGDDNSFQNDDDGVVLVGGTLIAGSTGSLVVTASAFGGYLQAWMDFNNNGTFEASERVLVDELLPAGEKTLTFDIPSTLVSSTVFARFRLGEFGLGLTGVAQIGEVEDYALAVDPGSIPLLVLHGPDFDEDGDVDGADFLAWQRGFGTSSGATAAQGDANSDGEVDDDDLTLFEYHLGQGTVSSLIIATGDFDSDGDSDGADFLAWQRGAGQGASLSSGDGNQDGSVDGADLQVWGNTFDAGSTSSAVLAATQPPPSSSESLATYAQVASSSIAASFSAVAPRVTQPGFREDFVAGVVDTAKPSLASLASEVERGSLRRSTVAPLARSEYRFDDSEQARVAARTELGLALRDRVWEQIPSKRQNASEEIEQLEVDSEEALAEAFGEEINWLS